MRPLRSDDSGGPARHRGRTTSALASLPTAGLLALTAALPATAQEPGETGQVPDTVDYELQGITVEAVRPSVTGGGASAVRLDLDSMEMATPSPTLSETLQRMPLIRVRQNSRGQVQPSLRGMEERQIAVLMDGVPITIGWDNRTDLSVIPMNGARNINMVRGLSSVLAGPNALGGMLEVEVSQGQPPERRPNLYSFQASADQTGAVSTAGHLNHLWRMDDDASFFLRWGGGYRSSPGDALPDGLPNLARSDDVILNTGWTQANGFVSGRWQAGPRDRWLAFSTTAFRADREVLPELHLLESDEPAPRFWRIPSHWRSLTSVSAGTGWAETPFGEGDLEIAAGLDLQHMEIDAYESLSYDELAGGEVGNDRTLSLRMVGDHTLGPGLLRGSVTLADTWHEQDIVGEAPQEYQQRLWSFGLETEQPLDPGGALDGFFKQPRLTLGASADGSSTPKTGGQPTQPTIWGWGARASGEMTLGDDRGKLHGGASRKVRFPALRELYSGALGKFVPNPDLDPLTLKVYELGTTVYATPTVELQGIVFSQRLEGSIVRAVLDDGRFQRQNRGETRAEGVELLANWQVGPLGLRGDVTLQDVTLLDDEADASGERPEYQPEFVANLFADVALPGGFRLRAGGEYLGEQFGADPRTGDFLRVDPTTYLEAGVSRRFDDTASLPPFRASVQVENLTDEAIFDQLGLPRPGRTVRLQLSVQ